jgi:dsDNA-binding SOS-regulon protein
LSLRKGQPTGDRWIKMRDISDTVEEWLVKWAK